MLQEKWVEAVGLRKLQNGEAWGEVYMEMQVGFRRRGGSLTSETNCPFKALVQVKLCVKEREESVSFLLHLLGSHDHPTTGICWCPYINGFQLHEINWVFHAVAWK